MFSQRLANMTGSKVEKPTSQDLQDPTPMTDTSNSHEETPIPATTDHVELFPTSPTDVPIKEETDATAESEFAKELNSPMDTSNVPEEAPIEEKTEAVSEMDMASEFSPPVLQRETLTEIAGPISKMDLVSESSPPDLQPETTTEMAEPVSKMSMDFKDISTIQESEPMVDEIDMGQEIAACELSGIALESSAALPESSSSATDKQHLLNQLSRMPPSPFTAPFRQDDMDIGSNGSATKSSAISRLEKTGPRKMMLRKEIPDSEGTTSADLRKSTRISARLQQECPTNTPSSQRKISGASSSKQRKRSVRSASTQNEPPLKQQKGSDGEGKKTYIIEKILDHRVNSKTGIEEWKVKWVGYDAQYNSWEPRESFGNNDMINAFAAQQVVVQSTVDKSEKDAPTGHKLLFKVEKILDYRINETTGREEWYVQWYGYGPDQNSWEPKESFTSDILIKEFAKKHPKMKSLSSRKSSRKPSSRKSSSRKSPKKPLADQTTLDKTTLNDQTPVFEANQEAGPSTSRSRPQRSVHIQGSAYAPPFPNVFKLNEPILDPALEAFDRKVTKFAENLRRDLDLSALEGKTPESRYWEYLRKETEHNKQESADLRRRSKVFQQEDIAQDNEESQILSYELQEMNVTALNTWHTNTIEALEKGGHLDQLGLTRGSTEDEVMKALMAESEKPSKNNLDIMKCVASFTDIVNKY